ncbi:MAG: hypothetical protein H6861_06455 [Rhodospirillales bacterium]|nr:hypothetical protein [Rhodospirillales bacterium]
MTEALPSTEHIFNALRRSISDEFDDLTIIYIPYAEGDIEAAFEAKKQTLRGHGAGMKIIHRIEKKLLDASQGSFFVGLSFHETASGFGLIKKREAIAVCFICQYDLERFKDSNTACKFIGYTTAFEAISQYLKITKPSDAPNRNSKTEHPIRQRLKGQAFAAMMLENTSEQAMLRDILKTLCECSTTQALHFIPEENPLPLAIDGINVVYKDLKDEIPPKCGQLEHTHNMAEEIGNTYDDISLRQWVKFCDGAQEMAWADANQNHIICAAVYGSDSPYIRSYAHICAEMLNMTPVPLKNNDIYNPFAEEDANERIHNRLCKTAFAEICETVHEENNPKIFLKKARKQTQEFLNGRPIGWCAPALIEAENAYRLFQESRTAEEDIIDNAFEASVSQIKWKDIRALNRKFITHRRNGGDLSARRALEIIGDDPTYSAYKNAFELLRYT